MDRANRRCFSCEVLPLGPVRGSFRFRIVRFAFLHLRVTRNDFVRYVLERHLLWLLGLALSLENDFRLNPSYVVTLSGLLLKCLGLEVH
jgi:hypothetical protein